MKKYAYLILAGLLATVACTKQYLDKQPLDKISDAVVWSDPNLINAFLTTQYHYTSTMSFDATTVMYNWDGDWLNNMTHSEQEDGSVITSFVSDESRQQWVELADYNHWKSQGVSIAGGLLEYWESPYNTIRNLNEFITKVKTSPVDPDIAKLRVAEARFLRAFNYFSMVKRYGGVPLITKAAAITDSHDILYPKRNSEKEIYDFVIAEMDTINEELANTTEYGRANQEAALALKCRAALYAGSIAQYGTVQLDGLLGIPSSQANDYYQKSYDAATAIIQGGKYSLYTGDADKVQNFKNIFLVKHNSEIIMAVIHDGVNTVNNGGSSWSWDYINCPKPEAHNEGNTTGVYLEMVEQFENSDGTPGTLDRAAIQTGLYKMSDFWKNKDPRFYASIWTCGSPWPNAPQNSGVYVKDTVDFHKGLIIPGGTELNDGISSYNGVMAWGLQVFNKNGSAGYVTTGFGVMKYLDPTLDNMTWFMNSKTDVIVFRYGEVLLNYAEAAFELGKTGDALGAVNQIRARAGMPAQGSITRDLIRHERQVELAFENHRYWDVRRWRIATTELSKVKTGLRYILDYNTKKFKLEITPAIDGTTTPNSFPAINYYLPITNARTAQNPNLVENPGY